MRAPKLLLYHISSYSFVVLLLGYELWRNLGLALLCVLIITFILLADVKICLMVFVCVALTLVDVVGALHFWGTTVDPLSSVCIILAVGLAIDYPAHIAHAFLVATGNKIKLSYRIYNLIYRMLIFEIGVTNTG